MNLNLTDPRLIALAGAVIVIFACLSGRTFENGRSRWRACRKSLGPSTSEWC
jgi:hypothetical protein